MMLKDLFQSLAFLFTLFLVAIFVPPPASARVKAFQPSIVPPPPASRADRFGVYHWNINDAAMPAASNQLNWGADLVAGLGTRTIRIALATRDDYRLGLSGNPDLVQLAQHPAYDRVLKDSRFQTVMLTTYSRGAMASNWADGYTQTEYDTERDEVRRLGEYLLNTPAFNGKTFIILNWEGDNAMYLWANKRSVWDYYTSWIRSRVEGVKLARQKFPSSGAKLYSGLEFSQVRNWQTNAPCGTAVSDPVRNDPLVNRCVIDYVAPQVDVDYYSYSSWQTLADKLENPTLNLKQRYKEDLGFAMSLIKAKRPEVGENNFMLGEYGLENVRYGECNSGNYINEMIDAFEGADAFQLSYSVFWQVVDNAPYYGVGAVRFGLYKNRNGQPSLSAVGENFKKRLAGQAPINYSGCPRIRSTPETGVLNSQGIPFFQINPDSVVSIYAQGCCTNVTEPFSATGNTVHFEQAAREHILPSDNSQFFYESPSQINFSMPPARRPGEARIFVTDARGFDSNAVTIVVTCEDCPRFGPCGLLESNFQTLQISPGDAITLTGERFSASGNSVVIEQRVTQHTFQKWTLPPGSLLSESTTELKVKLPGDLVAERETRLYVVNALGRESVDTSFPISQPCGADCAARLKPCQALVADSGQFLPGKSASVLGRFPASGNKIIIEQVDKQFRVYRQEISGSGILEDTDKRIRFTLPTTLFAGRAMLYVVDAQGRESRAQTITVSPSPLTTVSSANYRGASLAVESLATIFSSALATVTQAATSTPLPTELAGTRVSVKDSLNVERDAPLFFVSPTQINFQIPPGTATGLATVTVFNGFGSSSSGTMQIANVAPGIFAANSTGKGLASAVALRVKTDGSQIYESISSFDPIKGEFVARPIDLSPANEQVFLLIFGTGIRKRSSLSAVLVQVGGTSTQINFAGVQANFAGLDQINALLPRSLIGRGEVDVVVGVDGLTANTVRISIK